MNVRRAMCAAVLLMIGGADGPLVAHHSFSMFDMEKNVTYTGVVVEYMWSNPHVHITIDIKPGAWRRTSRPGGDGTSKAVPPAS